MNIFATSDLHDEKAIRVLKVPIDAGVIVLSGDLEHPQLAFDHLSKFNLPIIAVAGNHDFFGKDITEGIAELKELARHYDNVYFLENETIDIGNVRFIASTFWSNYGDLHPRLVAEAQYNMMDSISIKGEKWWQNPDNEAFGMAMHDCIIENCKRKADGQFDCSILPYLKRIDRNKFHPIMGYQLNQQAVKFVASELAKPFSGKKVVVTHHPPSWEALRQAYCCETIHADLYNDLRFTPPGYDQNYPFGFIPEPVVTSNYGSSLSGLFNQHTGPLTGADIWVHGHTHYNFEYALNGTRFIVNALGRNYCPIEKVESKLVRFEDGLIYAFENVIYQTETSLAECIEQLSHWAVCDEIKHLHGILIREAVLEKIESIYTQAKLALSQFIDELNKGLALNKKLTSQSLFNVIPNAYEFYISLFEKHAELDEQSEHFDPSMLSTKHIEAVIEKLTHIKDAITSKDWLLSVINQDN
jgi:predicted phosphodiesterase